MTEEVGKKVCEGTVADLMKDKTGKQTVIPLNISWNFRWFSKQKSVSLQYWQRVVYQCRTKKFNRGEIGGLNDKQQDK